MMRAMLAWLLWCAVGAATADVAPAEAPATGAPVERTAFDHLTTGFELLGNHRDLPCESCHRNAIFTGTPRDCASCHGLGTQVRATAKPLNHILSSSRCESCHTPVAFNPAVNFDHAEVRGSCSSCHNGAQAQGKGPTHIDTSLECDACHSTLNWAGAQFDHLGVVSGCATCHNGVSASGLPGTHMPTDGAACELCHVPTQYTSFSGALMNHAAVTPPMPCAYCHEAGKAFIGVAMVTRPAAPHPSTGDCGSCHLSTISFKSGTLQPANHIPTSQPCSLCHSNPADFSVYVMKHDGISNSCAECHAAGSSFANMAPPVLKLPPANHIPIGSASCESCHSATSFDSFVISNKSPPMNHAAVPGVACATCHATGSSWVGTPTTVLPPGNHLPFGTAACESCHAASTFSSFTFSNLTGTAPPSMVHSVVSAMTCSACHEAGLSWAGAPATKLRPVTKADGTAHVATGECSTCHFNTTSFKGATDLPNNHIPLPAADTNNCVLCHTTPGNYTLAVMNHANIASNCAQCHALGKSFANMAPPALKLPPANHIPIGSAACESCHSATSFSSFVISNKSPPMNHAAVPGVACAACHAAGSSWVGTPATVLPPGNHVPFGTAACESCHAASTFGSFTFSNLSGFAPPSMVHSVVSATVCTACHEAGHSWAGASATVLRPATKTDGSAHVSTGECSTCHFNTTSFKGATDLPSNHIPLPSGSSSQCSACHSNATNYAIYTMDHAVVTTTACAVCHAADRSFANMAPPVLKVPPANHIPIGSAACESCHSATNFGNFTISNKSPPMNHAAVSTLSCASCHGSGLSFVGAPTVLTLPATHVPVGAADCALCHSNSNFSSFGFANVTGTTPPAMVHSAVGAAACSSCHERGNSWIGAPATVLRPATKADGSAHVASGECSTCHFNTTSFKGATDLPNNHIPLPAADNNSCVLCHTAAGDYAVAVMNHANIASNCAQCHALGKSFANMAPPALKLPPANHVPIGTASCESCHNATSFSSFVISNKSPPMNHAAVPAVACATCHATGSSWVGTPATVLPPANHLPFGTAACESCHSSSTFGSFMFANASGTAPPAMVHSAVAAAACSSCHERGNSWIGAPATVLRPVTKADGTAHVATGECSTCHFNTTSFKGATDLPNNHIPLPAADTNNCVLCHTTPGDYTVAVMNHVNIASNCAQCHALGKSFANMAPPVLKLPPANHIPIGSAACESCHSAVSFTSFVISNKSPPMNHAAVPGVACAACHATGSSWVGTPATVLPPANHVPFGTAACESCHAAGTFSSFTFSNLSGFAPPSMVHSAVSTMVCSACHEAGLSWAGAPVTRLRPATKADGTAHVVSGECSTCHFNTTSFKGATDLPNNHVPLPAVDNNNCVLCHTTPGNYSVAAMNHVNITANCSQCHGAGKSFANMAPPALKLPPANHIPYGTAACESCHAAGTFTTFVISNKSPPMNHAAVASLACSNCHATGMTFAGTPATVVEPGNHIPIGTTACTNCHSTSNFTSFVIANAVPPMNHAGFTTGCTGCHGVGQSWIGTPTVKSLPATHIPTGSMACEGCHSNSSFSSFAFVNASGTAPASMVHSQVTAIVCSTCHEAGKTFIGTPATRTRPVTKADGTAHVVAGECSTCHFNTASFKGATDLPANHLPLPAADNNNCVLCHTTAGNYSVAVMNHTNIASNCSQCHGAGKSFANMAPPALVLPPANHIPFGTATCESCHAAGTFTTFVISNKSPPMNHAVVATQACSTCHAAAKTFAGTPATVVEPGNHIPIGTVVCTQCHAPANFSSFAFTNASGTAPAAMVHTGFSSGCVNCHGAGKTFVGAPATKVLPANHIPTASIGCEGCHSATNFSSFAMSNASGAAPPSMVHSLVTAIVCSSCHEAGLTFVGTPATKVRPAKKANGTAHVAAGECSTCHFNTTSFTGATDLPTNHIPLPAADANSCALCHTTAGTYSLATMNHVNITANCAQCHAYGLVFANMTAPTLKSPPSGATGHIPSNAPNGTANVACELCHTATVFTTFSGTIMKHAAVSAMTCMSCHEIGKTWKTNTGVNLWVRPSANHHAGVDCGGSGCHSTRDKFAARRTAVVAAGRKASAAAGAAARGVASTAGHAAGFDHRRVPGSACLSCHSVANGLGKPATHIATSDSCDSCHATLAWLPVARVDHLQVRGNCNSCHNGVLARGKGRGHVSSDGRCETCHTSNAWTPARFDHGAVVAHSCRSCHNGLQASGPPIIHVPTSAQCDTCHGTLGWKPAILDHTTLTASCVTCHNNIVTFGVTPTHIATRLNCATCHNYPDWAVLHFVHAAAAYPGTHRAALTCSACHTSNSEQIPWPSLANAGTCGGCHAAPFRPTSHPKTAAGLKYTLSELRDCTAACHVYSDATLGTVVKAVPANHHRVGDSAFRH